MESVEYPELIVEVNVQELPCEPGEFVFDDEPLEGILYGEDVPGPTVANYFSRSCRDARRIVHAHEEGNIHDAIEQAFKLAEKAYPLSTQVCFDLATVLRAIVPNRPNPVMEHDLSPLSGILEQLWNIAIETDNKALQESVGTSLFRWYEHNQRYEEARRVLERLMEIHKQGQDLINEAILLNNFAFEYLLEGRWCDAIPLFEKAAEMFREKGIDYECANARANYWTCRIESGDPVDSEEVETELRSLVETLGRSPGWHQRKPLIALAGIEERRGNIRAAKRLVKKAIKASMHSQTRYSELDTQYLEHLGEVKKR